MQPRDEPLVVPFAEDGGFVHETARAKQGIEARGEGIPVDIEDVLVVPCRVEGRVRLQLEVLLLGMAVGWIALADAAESDVEEGDVGRAGRGGGMPRRRGGVAGICEDGRLVVRVEEADEALTVVSTPAAVARVAACC